MVNAGGTQLKAEELLSVKPFWNKRIELDRVPKDLVDKLYKNIGINNSSNYVLWDLVATVLDRIDKDGFLFGKTKLKNAELVDIDRITTSFRLISTIFRGGMSTKYVSMLENNRDYNSINWNKDIDDFIEEINIIIGKILEIPTMEYLRLFKIPLHTLLGNAITLEFISIAYKDWVERGFPRNRGSELKQYHREILSLLDRLIYEKFTKLWRGSGDSKMSKDIQNWKERIVPINQKDWETLIQQCTKGYYNGNKTTQSDIKPLLYYFSILNEINPSLKEGVVIDVDHIIPQEKLKNNTMVDPNFLDSLLI